MDAIRSQLRQELRDYGFLTYEINLCVDGSNNEVCDRRSALRWLLNKLTPQQKHLAKIMELQQYGFNKQQSEIALKKFDNNFQFANEWLIQDKPMVLYFVLFVLFLISYLIICLLLLCNPCAFFAKMIVFLPNFIDFIYFSHFDPF